jgi:tRNA-splicing ligase RtcB (3'-phosphate/5'-hydroxy nucleic acid ligase)
MEELARLVPKGMGRGAVWEVGSERQLRRVLAHGAVEVVDRGFGDERDLARCEDGGVFQGADPAAVSEHALERGLHEVGSLGSGNHFLEVQAVDLVADTAAANALGLQEGQVCVMIHSRSRGLGHQVCTDYVRRMGAAMARYGIHVPDRQLACAPVRSPEGEAYLAATAAAANYGRANRHLLAVAARRAFAAAVGTDRLELVYDVSHNLAKLEDHEVGDRRQLLCVHRKGATRALPPGHPDLPPDLAAVGQPVLVPGSMGTASHVLVGIGGGEAFHSTCHGAGRAMSRTAARKRTSGRALRQQLESAGVAVRAGSNRGLAEEAPFSYKDVDAVVAAGERAGLARRIARLVPLGVLKG